MCNSGSGSWSRPDSKSTTESQYRIDIRWMKRQGLLVPGSAGTLSWSCRGEPSGSIAYRVESDRLVLIYRYRPNNKEAKLLFESSQMLTFFCMRVTYIYL